MQTHLLPIPIISLQQVLPILLLSSEQRDRPASTIKVPTVEMGTHVALGFGTSLDTLHYGLAIRSRQLSVFHCRRVALSKLHELVVAIKDSNRYVLTLRAGLLASLSCFSGEPSSFTESDFAEARVRFLPLSLDSVEVGPGLSGCVPSEPSALGCPSGSSLRMVDRKSRSSKIYISLIRIDHPRI